MDDFINTDINTSHFITEWFNNPEWWFNQSDAIDKYLSDKYHHLLDINIDNRYHAIVVYDQLVRHIFRHTCSNHIILFFLNKAIIALNNIDLSDLNKLTPAEWCFAMLSLRHTNDLQNIHTVMKLAWDKLNCIQDSNQNNIQDSIQNKKDISNTGIDDDIEQIRRFLKATYERCPIGDQSLFMLKHVPDINTEVNHYYDPNNFKNVLRYCPQNNPITIKHSHPFIQKVQEIIANFNPKNIIVSLSGGVDSMVSLWILKHLQPHFNYTIKIVNINYCNRKISDDEQRFATAWALSLGFEVNVRRIEEIRREPCMKNDMRNIYESYTRNVRYATYKTVDQDAYVILGHNKDDCLENIFQNISHNTKYEELRGMQYLVIQDDIKFLRPLLDIPKDDIIKFANEHNIPYLPNSTPEWSQRGQIRNKIVPCLDSWNSDLIPGLYDLAKIVKEMHKITMTFVSEHVKLFTATDKGYIASINSDIYNNIKSSEIYWKTLIDGVLSAKISKRSMKSFLERLTNTKLDLNDFIRFNLKKDIQIIIKNKNVIIVEILTIL